MCLLARFPPAARPLQDENEEWADVTPLVSALGAAMSGGMPLRRLVTNQFAWFVFHGAAGRIKAVRAAALAEPARAALLHEHGLVAERMHGPRRLCELLHHMPPDMPYEVQEQECSIEQMLLISAAPTPAAP